MDKKDREMVCTAKYISNYSGREYCSRFDSMIPPKNCFVDNLEESLQQEAEDLSNALERYKLINRRNALSFEELIYLLRDLGYRRE